jgi:hypothetical protein
VTGGTEGVSGAALSANPATLNKPGQGYVHTHISFPPVLDLTFNDLNFSDPTEISGDGFAPYEIVSFWVDQPRSECSSFTAHADFNQSANLPPIFVFNARVIENQPIFNGEGSFAIGSFKADASGHVSFFLYFSDIACEGVWHVVGRGNSSHNGGDTWVTLVGNPVSANAFLVASPSSVVALFGHVNFNGSGFGSHEHVSCWLTSPEGQVLGVPDDLGISGHLFGTSRTSNGIYADAGGNIAFGLETGSFYVKFSGTENDIFFHGSYSGEIKDPIASEGALGVWAMTCRGDTTGNTGIATFTIVGGAVDP